MDVEFMFITLWFVISVSSSSFSAHRGKITWRIGGTNLNFTKVLGLLHFGIREEIFDKMIKWKEELLSGDPFNES